MGTITTYETDRGIGRELEFMGLKSSFLMILSGVLILGILMCMVLFMAGVGTLISIAVALVWSIGLSAAVVYVNRRYGSKGIVKMAASKAIPEKIRIGIRIYHLFKQRK